jgi:hypothetical protein
LTSPESTGGGNIVFPPCLEQVAATILIVIKQNKTGKFFFNWELLNFHFCAIDY